MDEELLPDQNTGRKRLIYRIIAALILILSIVTTICAFVHGADPDESDGFVALGIGLLMLCLSLVVQLWMKEKEGSGSVTPEKFVIYNLGFQLFTMIFLCSALLAIIYPPLPINQYVLGGVASGPAQGLQVAQGGSVASVSSDGTCGSFVFGDRFAKGYNYGVSIHSQPSNGVCQVQSGSGTLDSDRMNVNIRCLDAVLVTVSQLAEGQSVTISLNGGTVTTPLTFAQSGTQAFAAGLADGATWQTSVTSQPTGQSCTATTETGTVPQGSNVPNYVCTNT